MTGSKGPPLGVCLWRGVHFELKILLKLYTCHNKAYKARDISWLPFISLGFFK